MSKEEVKQKRKEAVRCIEARYVDMRQQTLHWPPEDPRWEKYFGTETERCSSCQSRLRLVEKEKGECSPCAWWNASLRTVQHIATKPFQEALRRLREFVSDIDFGFDHDSSDSEEE